MLIVSKTKDYYDGVVGTVGIDKTIVFNRKTEFLKGNDVPEIFQTRSYTNNSINSMFTFPHSYRYLSEIGRKIYTNQSYFIVGFCGKLYLGYKFMSKGYESSGTYPIIDFEYDLEKIEVLIKSSREKNSSIRDIGKKIQQMDVTELFLKYNTPIFVFDGNINKSILSHQESAFIVNPNLSDYRFFKVVNAFDAFLEIQRFMSNVLTNDTPMTIIADKYKIAQHGFDKWSFRKEPESKK